MQEADQDKLHHLLAKGRKELQDAVGNYGRLLRQLEEFQRALDGGHLDREVLEATQRAFFAFPQLAAEVRAAAATADGLEAARALLVEVRNRIVMLGGQQQS